MEQSPPKPNPERITPRLARQDYFNEIVSLLVCMDPAVSGPVSHELFLERIKKWSDPVKGYRMRSFSEKFPPDKYSGIIEGQPVGMVERFDAIAKEINDLYSSGQLTEDKVSTVAKEMRNLCYQ